MDCPRDQVPPRPCITNPTIHYGRLAVNRRTRLVVEAAQLPASYEHSYVGSSVIDPQEASGIPGANNPQLPHDRHGSIGIGPPTHGMACLVDCNERRVE